MDQDAYERVSLGAIEPRLEEDQSTPVDSSRAPDHAAFRIRWFVIPLSILLCTVQAVITICITHLIASAQPITSTLIPVIGVAFLFLIVLAINPLLRLLFRGAIFKPFGRAELISIFSTLLITAGISTTGLADQIIPLISAPWNPDWNTKQRQWDTKVLPHLNKDLYLYVPPHAPEDERITAIKTLARFGDDLITVQKPITAAARQTLGRARQFIEQQGLANRLDVVLQLDQIDIDLKNMAPSSVDSGKLSESEQDRQEAVKSAVSTVRTLLGSGVLLLVIERSELDDALATLGGHLGGQSQQRQQEFAKVRGAITRKLPLNATLQLERILTEGQPLSPQGFMLADRVLRGYFEQDQPALADALGEAIPTVNGILSQNLARATIRSLIEGLHVPRDRLDDAMVTVRNQLAKAGIETGSALNEMQEIVNVCYRHNAAEKVITDFRRGLDVVKPHADERLSAWWPYYKTVIAQIPWWTWIKPLAYWMIFVGGCYGAFYCLAYVVLDYWTRRDKLIFPLAQLPESLVPQEHEKGWIPKSYKTVGLWVGIAIPFLLLSFNALATMGMLPGASWIKLGFDPTPIIKDTMFEGLITNDLWQMHFLIVFTAIGISFLLPTQVSFSIWFYFLVGKSIILICSWLGYGRTGKDFPADWLWQTNPVTSMGAGGIMLFSAISLWRCLAEYRRLAGQTMRWRLMMPVIGLMVFLAVITGWLWWNWSWNPSSLLIAITFVGFVTLLTLGLMRMTAESGMYWIQNSGGSIFHFFKALGLGAVVKTALIGPLMVVYSVMFLELKTYMAPNILNAARMREDVRASRLRFHANIVLSIAVTIVVSLAVMIMVSHIIGANRMNSWFFKAFPELIVDQVGATIMDKPEFHGADTFWYGTGAAWVAVTAVVRRAVFWFPHPIGFIMLINPLTANLWFSFLLGWLSKTMVVKYGGKVTFDKVRLIFIGLIIGEIMAVFIWSMIAISFDVPIGKVTMNRLDAG